MTHPFRTRRLALFAATSALAAGAVLVPTTAFAAAPAAPHAVLADGGGGDRSDDSTLMRTSPSGDGRIKISPDRAGSGKHRPGKGGSDGGVHVPKNPEWQCIAAPCGPPGTTTDDGRTRHG
ncbi:hypothetical protein [Streptomyces sp. A0592]|uniref:hypothetical protein n=1 Tax=Streptomyces sp. A0592 TaxID=2563099 RepID=UPI00109E5615|nr:hypothetical protein [Streptomyces sp. A0592]THA82785.1 hypothetical protein E6U81_19790 [Streptomyces sp. A0592]